MGDNAELTKLQHTLGVDVLAPCINSKEDVVHEYIEYASEDVSLPTFLYNEDVIINTPL